ncbi:hypothetical protein M2165_003156 [Variovorax sp. TBS-050B]|uniref:hypothetical protein n=1 Tax=Variovorax sp. TBS-050B TaxID=2940551 RepID=UPI0024744EEA|nr:hypothetical protein [Variovorax sp. TBS-050B]MDH6593267.1 hypothetical protein [Variovorax sp. TBS-050B]
MRTSPFFVAALAAIAFGAHADVVRCTDADERVTYTDGGCPPGSRLSRQVPLTEPVAVIPTPGEARRPVAPPPVTAPPAAPAGIAGNAPPSGPAIIPRHVDEPRPATPADPPVYSWGPDPYYDGGRPIIRPRPPRPVDPGPPPGQRPCANLAGIKRNNC